MRRGQQNLDYDITKSPNMPTGKRSHIMVADPRETKVMTLCSGLCLIAYHFVVTRGDMKQFYEDNKPLIEELTDEEKERLRATFRAVLS